MQYTELVMLLKNVIRYQSSRMPQLGVLKIPKMKWTNWICIGDNNVSFTDNKKNLSRYDFDGILCLIRGLTKSDLVLLEKIVIEMGQPIPQIENNRTTDDMHEMVINRINRNNEFTT
jgi:hypothetical protein